MKYFTKIDQLEHLTNQDKTDLTPIVKTFKFRCNEYYLSLIDWQDPDDPIRRIIIPHKEEIEEFGKLDPSDEYDCCIMPGIEHKYRSTILLLISNTCECICRFCFRKRLFNVKSNLDINLAVKYIKQHPEISDVLLTGGDPLTLKPDKIEKIIAEIMAIDHVRTLRIGTKMLAFNPYLILEEPGLIKIIKKYNTNKKRIYIMTHFIHPRELTDIAVKAINMLQKTGIVISNQMPLIKKVNADSDVLAELLKRLSFIGIVPYYIFQCRPALGNKAHMIPIEEGFEIVEKAKSMVSGLAKRARYVMSHSSGKIEIVGKSNGYMFFKYLSCADSHKTNTFLTVKSNPNAFWLDDY